MKENKRILSRRKMLKGLAAGLVAVAGAPVIAAAAKAAAAAEAGAGSAGAASAASAGSPGADGAGRIARRLPVDCTECDRCMPCGYGVDIPGNFKVYNELLAADCVPDIDHDPGTDSSDFNRRADRFLKVYDRTIADRHQAQRCIRCYHCTSECDQHLFIVSELAELTRITDYLRDRKCRIS